MILRFGVFLRYEIVVPASETFATIFFEYSGAKVTVYPLMQYSHVEFLMPVPKNPPEVLPCVRLGGHPAIPMDFLVVDIQREHFERPLREEQTQRESESIKFAYEVIDLVLNRMRALLNSPTIRLTNGDAPHYFQFLTDEGAPLSADETHLRQGLSAGSMRLQEAVLGSELWNRIVEPVPSLPLHRVLMLEAKAISPEMAAIVLAFSSVESATKSLITALAKATLPESMARWLGDEAYFRRRTIEGLLRGEVAGLTGRNLQQENPFWVSFKELLQVRNNLVHDGRPSLHGVLLKSIDVDPLLEKAEVVLTTLEELFPSGFIPRIDRKGIQGISMELIIEMWQKRRRLPIGPNIETSTPSTTSSASNSES